MKHVRFGYFEYFNLNNSKTLQKGDLGLQKIKAEI